MNKIMIEHEEFIKRTYQLAKSAQEKGNHPFGALLVIDNRVVFTAENSVITDNDITKHAELNLVSKVTQELDPELYSQGILYTSTEPCGSPFNTLIVTPQNNLVACFEVVNDSHPLAELATIGRITSQGVEIDEEARLRLRRKIEERRASCRDCFCYWSCAGGCLPRTYSPDPEGHLEHGVHCELIRTLQREMLLKHIATGNGLRKRTRQRSAAGDRSTSGRKNH